MTSLESAFGDIKGDILKMQLYTVNFVYNDTPGTKIVSVVIDDSLYIRHDGYNDAFPRMRRYKRCDGYNDSSSEKNVVITVVNNS